MARKYLKNRERIILHLSRFRGNVDNFNAPYFITQDGIAEAIGVGRNNVSRELNKLIEDGLVVMKKARVPNSRNRKNVYILTSSGIMKAKEIRENIRDLYIHLINFSGESESITVKEAQRMYNLDLITIAINLTRDLVLDLKAMMRKDGKKVHYIEENFTIKSFYGRDEELKALKNWIASDKRIMIVNGISGIGKTTLLLKFVNEYLKDRDVFFIRIEEYKNAVDILYQFAEFFSMVGDSKLERYLMSHGRSLEFEISITNALMIIKEMCSGEIIIFDNVEDANPSAKMLIQKLIDMLDGENCKIILA
jgi:DNA-binding MarR family transcriptional regulator